MRVLLLAIALVLLLAAPAAAAPPPADTFATPFVLSDTSVSVFGEITEATAEPGEPDANGSQAGVPGTFWFTLTAQSSRRQTLYTCDLSTVDTTLGVFTGTRVDQLTPVGTPSVDDPGFCGPGNSGARVTFDAVSGTTYRIQVGNEVQGAAGRYNLVLFKHGGLAGADVKSVAFPGFPATPVGQISGGRPMRLINGGGAASPVLGGGAVRGGEEFFETSDTCAGASLAPDASCRAIVRFAPSSVRSFTDNYDIAGIGALTLTGTGSAPSSGPTGPTGPGGATGATGPTGPGGAAGANGAPGTTGATGATGPTGPGGAAGANGANGASGANGAPGAVGATGATGPTGPGGAAGANGANGADGATGATGPRGEPGADGDDGSAGSDGAQGPAGPAGADGPAGPMGAAGAPGAAGPAGPAGRDGSPGPRGAPGPAVRVTCTVTRRRGTPRVRCTVKAAKPVRTAARLRQGGRTVAAATGSSAAAATRSVLARAALRPGTYVLELRSGGRVTAARFRV